MMPRRPPADYWRHATFAYLLRSDDITTIHAEDRKDVPVAFLETILIGWILLALLAGAFGTVIVSTRRNSYGIPLTLAAVSVLLGAYGFVAMKYLATTYSPCITGAATFIFAVAAAPIAMVAFTFGRRSAIAVLRESR